MDKMTTTTRVLLLLAVLAPYLALVGYSIAVYPNLPEKLAHDLPKIIIFAPALIAAILPLTYAVMVIFFAHYLRRGHFLTIAAFMDLGILGLVGAVYLIKTA